MDNKGYNKSKQVAVEYRLADEKLADELQVKSDDWFKTLTRDEKEAIKDYTDTYYARINKYLRGEDISEYFDDYYTKKDLEKTIENLDSALSKLKLNENITFYRGVSREELEYLKTFDTLKAYTSLTTDKDNVAKDFAEYNGGNNGTVVKFNIPREFRGGYIGTNSYYSDEKEFLLLRNSKYSIKFLNESWEVTVND